MILAVDLPIEHAIMFSVTAPDSNTLDLRNRISRLMAVGGGPSNGRPPYLKGETAMRVRKLHNPDTGLYRLELVIGWRSFPLSGFWFGQRVDY